MWGEITYPFPNFNSTGVSSYVLQWRQNERRGVSNQQQLDCCFNARLTAEVTAKCQICMIVCSNVHITVISRRLPNFKAVREHETSISHLPDFARSYQFEMKIPQILNIHENIIFIQYVVFLFFITHPLPQLVAPVVWMLSAACCDRIHMLPAGQINSGILALKR